MTTYYTVICHGIFFFVKLMHVVPSSLHALYFHLISLQSGYISCGNAEERKFFFLIKISAMG